MWCIHFFFNVLNEYLREWWCNANVSEYNTNNYTREYFTFTTESEGGGDPPQEGFFI